MTDTAPPALEALSRPLAAALCASAGVGIGLEVANLMGQGQTAAQAAWALLAYFTILTNGLVAVVFGAIAVAGPRADRPRLTAGVVAAIVLVGVIFALLLSGLRTLAGATAAANFLLHQLNPVLALAFWLACARKGALTWRDPLLWALYPLAYLAYALVRGPADGHYPYPFIDPGEHGWPAVARNVVLIALAFVAAGLAMVWADRRLARRRR